MSIIGKWHELKVEKIDRDFVYLNHPLGAEEEIEKTILAEDGETEETIIEKQPILISMAHNQTTRLLKESQEVNVFVYNKKEGELAASMKKPNLELNQFAYLKIVGENSFAFFANIGLDADLFIFKSEHGVQPELGKKYIVSLRIDEPTGKLKGDLDLEKLLSRRGSKFEKGEQVNCQIIGKTEGGFKINVNNKYWAYLRHQDAVSHNKMGDKFLGYIEDNKEDSLIVTMQPTGENSVKIASHKVLMLVQEKKYVRLTEDSDPEEIKLRLKMSKKVFKKALADLVEKDLVVATKRGIKLKKVTDESTPISS